MLASRKWKFPPKKPTFSGHWHSEETFMPKEGVFVTQNRNISAAWLACGLVTCSVAQMSW
jgi:hypothetical protein